MRASAQLMETSGIAWFALFGWCKARPAGYRLAGLGGWALERLGIR